MKITTVIILSACLTASATGYTQTVSLSEKNSPLQKVFKELKRQTGYNFLYTLEQLEQAGPVTIEVHNVTLQQALDQCLQNKNLSYSIVEMTVVIKRTEVNTGSDGMAAKHPALIDVHGQVIDEKGNGVVATIMLKGTNKAVGTDDNGYFEISDIDDSATLVVSGVSIQTREVKVNGKAELRIIVKVKVIEGDDVIVKTNYWETRQKLNPGNITKVTSKEIEKNPVSNPLATLQANVPGLEITQTTGVPGGNFKVRIRGINSIANGNEPLYVIDGVPFTSIPLSFSENSGNILGSSVPGSNAGASPLNYMNPLDIESIEVLKDADATAIYGSRGANGVILITTKKGKAGKTKVDLNFYAGTGKVAKKMDLLTTADYIQMRKEAFTNDNITPTPGNAPDLLVWDQTKYTDWQKELIGGSANYTDAQLTISGGEKNTQFSIGGGYHKETTVFPGDNSDSRISFHAGVNNISANNKLRTDLRINYAANSTDLPGEDLTSRALTLSPNAPSLLDASGNLNWIGWNSTLENPLAYTKRKYEATNNNLIGNFTMSYSLLKGLDIITNLGYTKTNSDGIQTIPISSLNPGVNQINRSIFSRSVFQNWIVEPQARWRKDIKKGDLEVLVGATFLEQKYEGLAQYANGFSSEALMKNISAASTIIAGTNYYSQYRYNAIYSRANYTYDSKYVLNVTWRRDGSSRFGPEKQFANFGAAGFAWVFTEESFVQKALSFLNFGKLRVSYGTSGNDQIGDYQYLDTYSPNGSGNYQGTIGLAPQRLFNADFAWEENKKFEAGLELGIVNDLISLGISYYKNRSSSQLVGYPLAPTTGFSSIQGNFPATVQNTGVEFILATRNIQSNNFSWTSSLNLTVPRNKLIEFPNIDAFPAYANTYVVGEPLTIRKLYHYLGVDAGTGIYKFDDINKDGVFDFRDRQTKLDVSRKFFGGLQNNLQYKGFQLAFLFQFVKQEGTDYTRIFVSAPGTLSNQPDFVMNRWQKAGDNSTIQRFSTTDPAYSAYSSLYYYSDETIIDASFIRLKNISLSWTIPTSFKQKLPAEHVSLFMQAQNLFTITDYTGIDPETQGSFLPPLRVITGGIRLTF